MSRLGLAGLGHSEWKIILAIYVVLLVSTGLPYLYGFLSTPEGLTYTWITPVNSRDMNSYLSLIKQASQGEMLLSERYSSESVNNIISPLYASLGWASALLGIAPNVIFHLARLALILPLLAVLYLFLKEFIDDHKIRAYAFILISLASGFGFIAYIAGYELSSYDFWVPEIYIFFTSYTAPHLVLSLTLVLGILLICRRVIDLETTSRLQLILLPIAVLLLGFVHPYDLILIYLTVLFYALARCVEAHKKGLLRRFVLRISHAFAPSFLASLVPASYWSYLMMTNPVIGSWGRQNTTPTFLPEMISGLGILGFLALIYVIRGICRKSDIPLLPLAWTASATLLSIAPLGFQRRLTTGLIVPLGILAVLQTGVWCKNRRKEICVLLMAAVFIMAVLTNILIIIQMIDSYSIHSFPNYMETGYFAAFAWLDVHAGASNVVLCSEPVCNFVPAYSGSRVFLGHPHETADYAKKAKKLAEFFNISTPDDIKWQIISDGEIDFLIYGPIEAMLGYVKPSGEWLYPVFAAQDTTIYRVNYSRLSNGTA